MMAPELHAHPIQRLSTSDRFNLREKETAGQRESSWFCFCPIKTVLLAALAAAGVLAAQEPPKKSITQDSGIVLRQTVRRVRVDVVVTDAKGHPVAGLQASDFHVAEDGKPQSLRQFEWHSEENAQPALPKRPLLPPHTFMNLPEAPEHGPLMVLLYDALNTPVNDQLYARAQMQEFLKKSAGRRIAVFYLGDRLRLLQGFTSDADLLASAVNRTGFTSLRGYQAELTGYPPSETFAPNPSERKLPAEGRFEDREENARQAFASELLDDRVDVTLDALVQIGRFLSDLPGRKNLIWYSGSFPAGITLDPDKAMESRIKPGSLVRDEADRSYIERMKKATNLLNAAEVSIYPIDARGLLTDYPFERKSAEFATMNLIGEQTGGRAFYNTNGLKEALETAGDEGSSYYSLVYAPTNMKFNGSLRRISVHLEHGHYNLAYRRSYFASDRDAGVVRQSAADEGKAPAESTAAASQFGAPLSHQLVFAVQVDAVGAPAPATAAQMEALVPYEQQTAKAEHRKFVPPAKPVSMQQYAIQYGMLAKQLVLPISSNGIYQSDLSIAALAFDEDGATLWGTETRLKDAIPSSKIGDFRKNSYHAIQTFFVPVDTAVLRFVVHDGHSGRIGSMEVRLPLPPEQQAGAGAH
jgi:VWFA-related protein